MNNLRIEKKITYRVRNLDRYFNEVNKHKLLTVDREVELSQKIAMGDTEALNELVKANLKFVISIAKQYASSNPELLLDLISQGNIGLIDAAKTYDATKGFKFISYAVWHIRKEILHYFLSASRTIRVPQNVSSALNKAKKASSEFEQKHDREIEFEELEEIMSKLDKKEYGNVDFKKAYDLINGPTSLDAPINEDGISLGDVIQSEDSGNYYLDDDMKKLKAIMEICLKPRYIKIISQRLGLTGNEPMSWQEISKGNGTSLEAARMMFNKSISILRRFTRKHKISLGDFNIR